MMIRTKKMQIISFALILRPNRCSNPGREGRVPTVATAGVPTVWSVTRMSRHRDFTHNRFGSVDRRNFRLLFGEDRQIFCR